MIGNWVGIANISMNLFVLIWQMGIQLSWMVADNINIPDCICKFPTTKEVFISSY